MSQPTVISLFAGIGGFDLGFDSAGFRIVAHVEKDANCRKLLGEKWPDAVCLDDVCTAGAHNLPPCDVVTFGFPCQDLSVAGKRAGLAGGRSGLFYEATRIIDELKPAYCLFENVPGLLSSDGGRDFWRVLRQMDEIGYHGAWRTLDAQWFGVAQRRRRVFGLFSRLDSGAERCAKVLSLCESLRGHPAPSREAGKVAPRLAASGVGAGRTGNERNEVDFCVECTPALTSSGRGVERAGETRGQDPVVAVPTMAVNTGQGFWKEDEKAGTLGTQARGVHENNLAMIPSVCGCLSDGAHRGGGLTDRTPTQGASFPPSVANTLTRRMHKGPNTTLDEGQTLIPSGGGFDDGEKCFGIDEEQNAAENLMGCLKARKEGGGFEAAVAYEPYHDEHDGRGVNFRPTEVHQTLRGPHGADNALVQVVFKHSHFTRGKDGAPSEVVPPLSADADKGDQESVVAFHDVAGTLKDRGGNHAGNGAEEADRIVGCREVAQAITQNYGKQPDNSDTALGPNVVSFRNGNSAQSRSLGESENLSPTLPSESGGNKVCVSFAQNQLGEVRTGDVAGTVNTNSNASGRNTALAQIAMSVRRLTPTECERLQGFPDGWTEGFSDSTRYKMLGNAVCVNVSEWIAFRLAAQMEETK